MILSPEDFLQKAKEVATEHLPFVLFKYPQRQSDPSYLPKRHLCTYHGELFGKRICHTPFRGDRVFSSKARQSFFLRLLSVKKKRIPSPLLSSLPQQE